MKAIMSKDGKIMKMVQYGGAVFSRFCPKCGQEVNPAMYLSVNRFMAEVIKKLPHFADGKCRDCKDVKLPFLGWEIDLI